MQRIDLNVAENSYISNLNIEHALAPVQMGLEQVRVIYEKIPAYEGDCYVVPTDAEQMLRTNGMRMIDDIIVAPIPQNYGLITWNGAFLVIS